MIAGMLDSGAIPALQRLVQFTSARHRVLTDNIANLSTPYYKPRDLSVSGFQQSLADAVERRRRSPNPTMGQLSLRDTRELRFGKDRLDASPRPTHENVLYHDQNNRDLDRTMQRLAENTMAHRSAVELLRSEFEVLKMAIRERL